MSNTSSAAPVRSPSLKPGDRVVLSTFGTHGDLIPFVAIGLALQALGVRATVAASPQYRDFVLARGLQFAALSPSEAELERDLRMTKREVMRAATSKVSGGEFICTKLLGPYMGRIYDELSLACQGAQLLLSSILSFAAPLVAERTGIAWRSVCLQPFALMSPWDAAVLSDLVPVHRLQPLLGVARYARVLEGLKRKARPWVRSVDELRAHLQLPATERHPLFEAAYSSQGTFGMFDPLLMPSQQALPPNWQWAGFCHDDGFGLSLNEDLERFLQAGAAPVVFTLGTSAVHNPGRFYEAAMQATQALGLRAVLLCGDNLVRPSSPDVYGTPAASHGALFPRARAVVHQGGMGTLAQALRAGVPQLTVPAGNDQPDNAQRLKRLGVGLTLPTWRLSARTLRSRLATLLGDDGFARQAERLRATLRVDDGAAVVAQSLVLARAP